MKQHWAVSAWLVLSSAPWAGGADALPPDLSQVHTNAAATLRFRTPAGWKVEARGGEPEVTEARGGGVVLRVLRRSGETGLDSLHVDCMLVRLLPEKDSDPRVKYEYDFVGGALGERRILDSAFTVRYDTPVDGVREWRQRNVTAVGAGESVCIIGYSPRRPGKRLKEARRLLDAVMATVEFRPWR